MSGFFDGELHPSHPKTIAVRQMRFLHALVVDERAVGAGEIDDFHIVLAGRQPAVQSRDQGGIDDEVGARGAADGLDGAGPQAEGRLGTLENPHQATS